jgi:pyrroloquinoline quinone (PQQ) biosynthesis protein C
MPTSARISEDAARMSLRARVEEIFQQQVAEFARCEELSRLEAGRLSDTELDQLLAAIVRTHLRSPKLLAFIYALAPPEKATELLRHNLLEELGVEDEIAHPELLERLARAAGLGPQLQSLTGQADEDLKRHVIEPLLYGSLKEVGLAALGEIVAFEYMLANLSSRISRAIQESRGLSWEALAWFTHHSEVDSRHAEEGLEALIEYIRWYELSDEDALTILRMTFRENVFIKRYFGELAQARARGL